MPPCRTPPLTQANEATDEQEQPMTVTIRPADKQDIVALAELIEEIERFYGSTDIQPLEERRAQVEEALFGSPPSRPCWWWRTRPETWSASPPTRSSGRPRVPRTHSS
ncbi:hypothetical protein SHKM778_82490 [Streptomyces sp. KM77-8]|uniref:GNAT family N-acetyltransferase n=1 Tax=Streptomyces haneummycinicus TaxID=3074435 RepID=A0AAT9HWB0_9ACTN